MQAPRRGRRCRPHVRSTSRSLPFATATSCGWPTRRFGPVPGAAVRVYSREFYRRCDLVIAPSAFMRERLASGASSAPSRGRSASISRRSRRAPLARRCAANSDCPHARGVLAYAGRFSREKNLPVLLDAFRELGPRYHLVLAGPAVRLPLPPNVTLLPFLHSSLELARILASVDGLVHAGDQETFGLVLIEAMACGRGVIAANAGAIPEIVTPDTGVLVAPRDSRAMAAGIREFYGQGAESLGRSRAARAEREYSWATAMRGLLGLYQGALVSGLRAGAGLCNVLTPAADGGDRAPRRHACDLAGVPATARRCWTHAGARPLSLLVVPDYHHRAPVRRRSRISARDGRAARARRRARPAWPVSSSTTSRRRARCGDSSSAALLTRSEGEFAALSTQAAAWRIAQGVEMFKALGWPLHGFVPPAWLSSAPARAALSRCGHPFNYVTARRGIHRLPDWRFERTANLCYSPSSAPRRALLAHSRSAASCAMRAIRRCCGSRCTRRMPASRRCCGIGNG